MSALLAADLFQRYTLPGQTILDPFAGIGTSLVGITLLEPRNVILHELEPRFVALAQASLDHIRRHTLPGLPLGEALVLQGDSRHLPLPDGECSGILGSPPYAEALSGAGGRQRALAAGDVEYDQRRIGHSRHDVVGIAYSDDPANIGNLPHHGIAAVLGSPPFGGSEAVDRGGVRGCNDQHGGGNAARLGVAEPGNIANLTHAGIAGVIASPPYADVADRQRSSEGYALAHPEHAEAYGRSAVSPNRSVDGYGSAPGQIGHLAHRSVDGVIGSPPYAAECSYQRAGAGGEGWELLRAGYTPSEVAELRRQGDPRVTQTRRDAGYSREATNLGNQEGEDYAAACLAVYRECWRVVRPGGVLVLVTGDYVRNGAIVDLASDTIALCGAAGWAVCERWKHQKSSVSFWRRLHHQQGHPTVTYEDVLVFTKGEPGWEFAPLPPTTTPPAVLATEVEHHPASAMLPLDLGGVAG